MVFTLKLWICFSPFPPSPTFLLLCESGINPRCPLQYEKQMYFCKQIFWRHQALGFHWVNQMLASSSAYLKEWVAVLFSWEATIRSGNFHTWVNKYVVTSGKHAQVESTITIPLCIPFCLEKRHFSSVQLKCSQCFLQNQGNPSHCMQNTVRFHLSYEEVIE